jgi:serine/threonine-protein kinase
MPAGVDDTYLREGGPLVPLERKYNFIKRLGMGSFGRVFLVEHKHLKKEFALKILDYNYILQNLKRSGEDNIAAEFLNIKKRFIKEAVFLNDIKHPNIVEIDDLDVIPVKIKEIGKEIEVPFLTMKYIKGTTLKEKIKKGPLSIELALKIAGDILSALKAIHDKKNIVHRDIKPGNIIIEEDTGKAVLVDFGIAKDINMQLTTTGISLGTPKYMASELFDSKGKLSHLSDIYSFGVVLFEMLTGKAPFDAPDISYKHMVAHVPDASESNPQLPQEIDGIIKKAMAKKPKDRYGNAEEFLNALMELKKKYNIKDIPGIRKKEKIKKKFPVYISVLAITLFIIIAAWLIFKPDGTNNRYRELINSANQSILESDYEQAQN